MIDVKIVWKNVFLEARQELAEVCRLLRRAAGEARDQIAGRALCANRFITSVGKMANENIHNPISDLAHLVFGKFELR